MDEQIKKQAGLYFLHFYNLTNKWKILSEQTAKPLAALKNQAEQFLHIEKAKINNEFSDFPEIKEKLLFKVFHGINEDLSTLKMIQEELNMAVNELKNKLINFEKSTTKVDWNNPDQISGSALHPSLTDLLQMAYSGWRIYNDLTQNISNAFKSMDIRNEKSISNLKFTINDESNKEINTIIAFTQYCYNT